MHLLDAVIGKIAELDPLHGKKLRASAMMGEPSYLADAQDFLEQYQVVLKGRGLTLDHAVSCYLQMIADVRYESVQFIRSGEYSSKSFEEVQQRVYQSPGVMEYYMHGLLLSQFLWAHHYDTLCFFRKALHSVRQEISGYLEVGGGHGWYLREATRILRPHTDFEMIDISPHSLEMAERMIGEASVRYTLADVFSVKDEGLRDFICLGEVLEHMEDPAALLNKLSGLLKPHGYLFITTPTNAPAIDHIHLFRNCGEIRDLLNQCGYRVLTESCASSEDMSPEEADRRQITVMYAALLKINSE